MSKRPHSDIALARAKGADTDPRPAQEVQSQPEAAPLRYAKNNDELGLVLVFDSRTGLTDLHVKPRLLESSMFEHRTVDVPEGFFTVKPVKEMSHVPAPGQLRLATVGLYVLELYITQRPQTTAKRSVNIPP